MIKAKYKVGDVVKIKPGHFIGWAGKDEVLSDNNTFGVITNIDEFFSFTPDYYIDFLLEDLIEFGLCCYDENAIAGYANIPLGDDDICAEEMSLLL